MTGSQRVTKACPIEPGSFRDRSNRVFYKKDTVFRYLNPTALEAWQKLSSTKCFSSGMASGKIIHTEAIACTEPLPEPWVALLKHERVPFISYPYEWSFGMLKDAALLHLMLLLDAIKEGFILKDASAYNIQWRGTKPVFIDVGSFEPYRPGTPWMGYRQFCELFLYPLFLSAYKGLPFQPWLRGNLNGISAADCMRVMSCRDWLRPGVATHVCLQRRLQDRYSGTPETIKQELHGAGFHAELIRVNVKRLHRLVEGLALSTESSAWAGYANQNEYDASAQQHKERFVREVLRSRRWHRVWDLGCNTGVYSRMAAEHADSVVAMDSDIACIERLYQRLRQDEHATILPLVMPLTDPSPNRGWRLLERKGLAERGKPDLVFCLALIHHMVITENVPLQEWMDMLADLGASLVIEFITRADPMVQTLLRNKDDLYTDYDLPGFEQCLKDTFTLEKREAIIPERRFLYFATPR